MGLYRARFALNALFAILVLGACASEPTDRFEKLLDGSMLHAVPFEGGPLLEGSRCWPRGAGYDCIAIRRFDPPTLLVTRYATESMSRIHTQRQRFGGLFEPTPDEWFRQMIARDSITSQDEAVSVRSIPRIGQKDEWSREEAVELLRRMGVSPSEYLDCRAIQEVLVTSGTQGLMEGELDAEDLFG